MPAIRAIIFDFDGVVVDSEMLSCRAFSEALSAAGCPTSTDDAIAHYVGRSRSDTLAEIANKWGAACPPDIDQRLSEAADRHFAAGLLPITGAIDFITRVAGHLPKAIGSSSALAYLDRHVDALGLRTAFGSHVYSGRTHVTRGKPHPDIYRHAARQLGVDPRDAVIIEDSPIGARAGIAAGARVIGLAAASHCNPAISAALRAEGVETVLESYADVREHLGL